MNAKGPHKLRSNVVRTWVVGALAHLSCVALVACSGGHSPDPTARSTVALVNGTLSPAERDAVVFIRANFTDSSFGDCTGTLLSPHVVVTAKHCVNMVQPGEFVCTGAGTLVDDGQGAGSFGAKVEPSRIEIYTGTAPVGAAAAHALTSFTSESSDTCHDDIAVLVLDTPIQEPYPLIRMARPTVVGETVRLVGYGTLNHNELIERREIANVRVIDVGRTDGVQDPNATTPARTLVVGGATGCNGDSGGPALAMDTGALTGVYSRITGSCLAVDTRNTFMLASSFSDLLARAFEQAGEHPLLEPALATTTDPVGDADSGAVVIGAADSGAVVADSGAAVVGVGGSNGVVEPTQPSQHKALRCSLARPNGGGCPIAAGWLLLALFAGFSRRRFDGHLSSVD